MEMEATMIETPARTDDQPSQDEHRHDSAAGVGTQQQEGHDQLDETLEGDLPPLTPLCGAAEFAELMAEMVADEAPRLFAIVQEYGERSDGRIAAWGMAFEDHAKVVSVDSATLTSLSSLDRVVHGFSYHPNITGHVVWVNPDAATPPEQ